MASELNETNTDGRSGGLGRRSGMLGQASRQNLLAIVEQGISGAANFLTVVAVGRSCGSEELGLFSLGLTICFLLISAQEALITTPLTIYLPRLSPGSNLKARGSTVQSGVLFALLSSLLILLSAGAMLSLGSPERLVLLTSALSLAVAGMLLRELARRIAFAELRVRSAFLVSVTALVLLLGILGFWILQGRLTAATAFISIAIANASAATLWLVAVRRELLFDRKDLIETTQRHWKIGKLLFASHVVAATNTLSLPWIVAALLGTSATGVFSACESLIRLSNPVISGITSVLTPRAAIVYAGGGPERLRSVLWRTAMLISFFMLIFCVVIGIFGFQLLNMLYGSAFADHARLLLLLAIARSLRAISLPAERGLLVYERVKAVLIIDIAACVLCVSLTLALIPQCGVVAAALGAIAASTTILVLSTHQYFRYSKRQINEHALRLTQGE